MPLSFEILHQEPLSASPMIKESPRSIELCQREAAAESRSFHIGQFILLRKAGTSELASVVSRKEDELISGSLESFSF